MRLLILISFLIGTSATFAQQQDELSGWEKLQEDLVHLEMGRITGELELESRPGISQSLKNEIRSFERREFYGNEGFVFLIPQPIRQVMWEQLEDNEEANADEFKAYLAQAESYCAISRKDAITCFTVFLDNHLFMNQEQFAQMAKVVDANWCEGWNMVAFLTTFRSNRMATDLINSLDQDSVERILTEKQLQVFNELEEVAADPYMTFMTARAGDEIDFSKAEECINKAFAAQVGELEVVCDLTEKQRQLLNVAKNGALKSIRESWSKNPAGDRDNEPLTLTPLIEQLMRQSVMQKTLRKILDENQFAKIESERARRQNMRTRCFVNYLLFYAVYWHGDQRISAERRDEIANLMIEQLKDREYINFGTVNKLLKENAKDILTTVLTDEEWDQVGPHTSS